MIGETLGVPVVPSIGRIERVPLREVWRHEARNLTTWLETNIDVLADLLGLNLVVLERERSAGDFSVDLVAQEGNGDIVVIENQLERSDHDHLGKVLTYVAMVGAKRAIWIVAEPRPEHLKAVQWLNEGSNAAFHLVKLEAIRIAGSPPAPLLTVITGPSEAGREVRRIRGEQEDSANHSLRFWRSLLDVAAMRTPLHRNLSPSRGNWISTTANMPQCCGLNYVLSRGRGRVELYIDDPAKGKEFNEAVFCALEDRKDTIESNFREPLVWQELPNARACRICYWLDGTVNLEDEGTWPGFIDRLVESMIRFDAAIRPHLADAVQQALSTEAQRALEQSEQPS